MCVCMSVCMHMCMCRYILFIINYPIVYMHMYKDRLVCNYTHIEIVYTSFLSPCIYMYTYYNVYSVVQCYMWFVHTPLSPGLNVSM